MRPRRSLALAAIAVSASGCARVVPPTVPRRVEGEVVVGAAVAPTTYERFLEGERALARGELDEARRAFEEASPETDPVALGRLAEVEARRGDRGAADRLLAEGDRRFPESEALAMARGRIAERAGEVDAALAAYRLAIAAAPSSSDPVLAAAALLERSGRAEEAIEILVTFVAGEPDRAPAAQLVLVRLLVATRGSATAIEEAAEALHSVAPRHDDALRDLAERAIAAGRPEAAVALLRPLRRTEGDARTYVLALAATEGTDAALAALDRIADGAIGGPLGRGRLLLELGRPAMAAAVAEAIVDTAPEPSALLLLGRAERARGRTEPAIVALERVPEGAGDYVPAQIERARALTDAGQAARARRMLEALAPAHGETWPEIAEALEAISAAEPAAR